MSLDAMGLDTARAGAGRVLHTLGTLPVAQFLAHYWQRRPVCIRQAFAGNAGAAALLAPITRERLVELAGRDDVEARLVSAFAQRWRVRHGPFAARQLPAPARAAWTLLVQGVDLHDAGVAQLAMRFGFLPAARFDDVMISYASDGGGVGPHVDQYDVFLLQAQGRRRWRVAAHFDPQLVAGLPLRILANFRHEQEWVLEPGDLLYLPPGIAHEGVALGASITVSIGFRLPPWEELVEAWAEHRARTAPVPGRVPDTTRRATRTPARLPRAMVDAAVRELRRAVPSRAQARRTLLEHLTEPKPTVSFAPPRPAAGLVRFGAGAVRRGLVLDLRTRMLYKGADVAINGELFAFPVAPEAVPTDAAGALRLLHDLANDRMLTPFALSSAAPETSAALLPILHIWYRYGWVHLAQTERY